MNDTKREYNRIIADCKQLFLQKTRDYGPSWLLFRLPSITDQIMIKAKRIRQLEELHGKGMIPESVDVEYRGILNYCIMALIRIWYPEEVPSSEILLSKDNLKLDPDLLESLYDGVVDKTRALMIHKNHDYGEAWRDMRVTSITDQILVKISRIRNIEERQEKPRVSEDVDSHYSDILNYSVFALLKLEDQEKSVDQSKSYKG